MMKKLQKLGKALMLPVAALPICGILMGLGYAIAPGVMGVPGAATSGALYNIGFLLVKAGGALIDNMAWLFVIGVAVGLSDDRDGTSALAGLVSWLMMTNLLSTGVVTTLMPAIADDPVKTLAFDKIQNVFIAIIAGIIGSACYNRFKSAKLPDWLGFFSGKRCVAIVTGLVSIVVSVVLLFVWPIIFGALVSVGEAIIGMGGIGAGIYAFLNRLLIPTGLHHALNNVFWFDTIGPVSLLGRRHYRSERRYLEPRHVYVRLLPLHDVRRIRRGSGYDQDREEQEGCHRSGSVRCDLRIHLRRYRAV